MRWLNHRPAYTLCGLGLLGLTQLPCNSMQVSSSAVGVGHGNTHKVSLLPASPEAHLIPHCLPRKNGALQSMRMSLSPSASCHVPIGLCIAVTVVSTVSAARQMYQGEWEASELHIESASLGGSAVACLPLHNVPVILGASACSGAATTSAGLEWHEKMFAAWRLHVSYVHPKQIVNVSGERVWCTDALLDTCCCGHGQMQLCRRWLQGVSCQA